jgi:2-polyprenyl-6-methoxyphenol hydroxylase-like FAD-dependent oxidoreductase
MPGGAFERSSDLLVLGAGPAGCAAAIAARQAGFSVIVLESRATAQTPPGETLHPGVEKIFQQLGIWEALVGRHFHRHRGLWRESEEGDRAFLPYGGSEEEPWLGFQVDRGQLQEIFRRQVIALGGEIVVIRNLERVVREGTTVAGVVADDRGYHAAHVADATGRHAWLAEQLHLPAETHRPNQRLRFGWRKAASPDLLEQPLFRQRSDGWDWLSPLGAGRSAWVELRYEGKGPGIPYPWRIFRPCSGPGYSLLGDAASIMDPAAANGVLRACLSGIYVVHLITGLRRGAITAPQASAAYRKHICDIFDQTQAALSAGRA